MKQRKSPRAQRYDYTSPGGYFITICTKDREHYFGEIDNGKMILNELGRYCYDEIQKLATRKTVDIHERIVMPNHIHILLILSDFTENINTWYDRRDAFVTRPYIVIDQGQVSNLSLPNANNITHVQNNNYNGPRLWQIIGTFKSNITKYANEHNLVFARQSRYHDHIIRNEWEYNRVKYYIQTNPKNRDTDSLQ